MFVCLHRLGARRQNEEILSQLREDKHEAELVKSVAADVQLGRMSQLVPVSSLNLDELILAPCFSVEQGEKASLF